MRWITIGKTLLRYWRMAKDPRTPAAVRWLIYAGIVYSLSPVDLLPDWIPGLGLLDDAAVLPTLIGLAMVLVPKEVKQSHDAASVQTGIERRTEGKKQALEAQHRP